jgi:rare lipoprotein A
MYRVACRIVALGTFAALAACGTTPPPETTTSSLPSRGGAYRVGQPYQINGVWYYPREQPDYDETGVASWYGPDFDGRPTADGEMYDMNGLSAAHPTLPLPVNVRVTNLDNGKSIVLRVNDRGPFVNGRIIDVSKHAAELLGFYAQGTAKVRVTYLGRADLPNGQKPTETPPEIVTAVAAAPSGKVQMASLDVPQGAIAVPSPVQTRAMAMPAPAQSRPIAQPLSAAHPVDPAREPTGQVTTVPVPAVTHLYVQAGTFSNFANANRLMERFASAGVSISRVDRNGKPLYRVRTGPFDDLETANAALARLIGLGNNDAQIVVDQ